MREIYSVRQLLYLFILSTKDCSIQTSHNLPGSKTAKSVITVVRVCVEDPSSHEGMIKVSEKLIPYLPTMPTGANQKTILFGDQLYVERGEASDYNKFTISSGL